MQEDPFPSIPAALLNSADIKSYVDATGMIHPFHEKDLKSSSYAVRMEGRCVWWDENGKLQDITLDGIKNKRFKLLPNSIAFIELEPTFKLPNYIAVRFNLKIKNVYRGLLLGTGPLVDPGFEGKLYIPLHNFTTREYIFSHKEELVWLEFSKTSPIFKPKYVDGDLRTRTGVYKEFPEEKKRKTLDSYLYSASSGEPITSSIPDALKATKNDAEEARKSAVFVKKLGYVAALGFIATLISLAFTVWSTQQIYLDKVQTLEVFVKDVHNKNIREIGEKTKNIEKNANKMKAKVSFLEIENANREKNMNKIKKCLNLIKDNKKNIEADECEI